MAAKWGTPPPFPEDVPDKPPKAGHLLPTAPSQEGGEAAKARCSEMGDPPPAQGGPAYTGILAPQAPPNEEEIRAETEILVFSQVLETSVYPERPRKVKPTEFSDSISKKKLEI
jgi:hypothetical protein